MARNMGNVPKYISHVYLPSTLFVLMEDAYYVNKLMIIMSPVMADTSVLRRMAMTDGQIIHALSPRICLLT